MVNIEQRRKVESPTSIKFEEMGLFLLCHSANSRRKKANNVKAEIRTREFKGALILV